MSQGRKHYTDEEKIEILKVLETNDYNYNKTHKETGVAISTLATWYDKFGKQVLNPNRLKGLIKKVENKLAVQREEWLKEAFEVKKDALQRLRDMLPLEQNMDNVTKALRLLCEITDGNLSKEEEDEFKKAGQSFFQIVNQQLITKDGTKNIDP